MSLELKDMEVDADKVFYKAPTIPREVEKYEEPVDLDRLLDGLTLSKLQKIFESVMKRREDKIDPVRSTFAVSYTHLDVYKRQPLWRGSRISIRTTIFMWWTSVRTFISPRCSGWQRRPVSWHRSGKWIS